MLEFFGSTARESVEPIRWLPRGLTVGTSRFTQGIVTPATTRFPANQSPESTNAVKGVAPIPQESSRTTTTSATTLADDDEPLKVRQPKKAAYMVPSGAAAGLIDGPS